MGADFQHRTNDFTKICHLDVINQGVNQQ